MKVTRVDTWVATIDDRSGALARKLKALTDAGVNLEFIIARRAPERPGTGVIFATPIKGARQVRAAQAVGFRKTVSLNTVRVEGSDRKGQGERIAAALAAEGLNLRGLSAAAIGRKFVAHIALDNASAAARATGVLRSL
jgi:hypothetical protein